MSLIGKPHVGHRDVLLYTCSVLTSLQKIHPSPDPWTFECDLICVKVICSCHQVKKLLSWDHPWFGRSKFHNSNVITKKGKGRLEAQRHTAAVNTEVDIGLMCLQIRNARMANVPQVLRDRCTMSTLSAPSENKPWWHNDLGLVASRTTRE